MDTKPGIEFDRLERIRMLNRELAAANRRAAQRTEAIGNTALSHTTQNVPVACDMDNHDWPDSDYRLRTAS